MKKLTICVTLLAFCLTGATAIQADPGGKDKTEPTRIEAPANPAAMTKEDWKAYSTKLEEALASHHDGLKFSALRMIIQYGEYMEMSPLAVFDVMRIYRNHDNEQARRMAVVTLGHMKNDWAIAFLQRSLKFEKTDCIKHTMQATIVDYHVRQARQRLGPGRVAA